ncbi:MAG TPA: DUF2497 domain-containing protein [Methylocystis sp.]|nr:DUF2497 domain-containing protein [Methylocystis sp.]
MSEDRQTNEPSMEEILASIRRLIAEDEAELVASAVSDGRRTATGEVAKTAAPALTANEFEPSEAKVRFFAASMEADGRLARRGPDDGAETENAPPAEPLAEDPTAPDEAFLVEESEEAEGCGEAEAPECAPALVSAAAAASITAQFQSLAASRVLNDSGLLHEYAREMLRPMLRAWLDDNLPELVERLVRAEIERVARGGRR